MKSLDNYIMEYYNVGNAEKAAKTFVSGSPNNGASIGDYFSRWAYEVYCTIKDKGYKDSWVQVFRDIADGKLKLDFVEKAE